LSQSGQLAIVKKPPDVLEEETDQHVQEPTARFCVVALATVRSDSR